ncbi:hypothetical protein DL764_000534 [Monosporascus ibericus]|uniref:Uncharacterized protein n=1 Tax=Monosporascus ibericus TaxID=155417 RepID=A0A4Q4TYC1_9PEZI|nr:hypothetical protein DL764_000534 [Monosporascus ibericus]
MMLNRASAKHILAATLVDLVLAIPLQERGDNSNNGEPPLTYVTRYYYIIGSTVASEPLSYRPNAPTSLEDTDKAADGTLLSDQTLHEPPADGESMVFEENGVLLLERGEEAEPAKFRREDPTSPGAAEQSTVAQGPGDCTCSNRSRMGRITVRDDDNILGRRDNTRAAATPSTIITFLKQCRNNSNNNNHDGYNNYNYNDTYNGNTVRRDSHHGNVGPTTAIISSSSSTTIDYPVDDALDSDLQEHIDHRRAENHDWKQ